MVCAVAVLAAGAKECAAQGWGWGSSGGGGYERGGGGNYDRSDDERSSSRYDRGDDERPSPRRDRSDDAPPFERPSPRYEQPYGGPPSRPAYSGPSQSAPSYGGSQNQQTYGSVSPRCRDLEAQLSGGGANAGQDQLPRIENDMRQADAQYHRLQSEAERADCYEDMFLFGRSLRRSGRCVELDRQVQSAKAQLTQLKAQRDAIQRGSSSRGRRDDIVAELARNRCGDQYTREHEAHARELRNRSSSILSFFNDEESSDEPASHNTPAPAIETPGARTGYSYGGSGSYRTLCVRECDGFYFPVSNATSESHLKDDEAKCHSLCASPAELFYHRADQDVDQMVSLSTGKPYAQFPYAFRNRKVYIKGCSCKESEYSRDEIAKAEESLKISKRADASGGRTASDAAFAKRISQAVQNAPSSAPQAGSPAPSEAPQDPGQAQ
jgi:hypothetical protein